MWSYCKPCPGTFSTAWKHAVSQKIYGILHDHVCLWRLCAAKDEKSFQGGQIERKLLQKLSQLDSIGGLCLTLLDYIRQTKRPGEHPVCSASPRNQQHHSPHGELLSVPVCAETLERGILSSMIDLSNSLHHSSLRENEERWENMKKSNMCLSFWVLFWLPSRNFLLWFQWLYKYWRNSVKAAKLPGMVSDIQWKHLLVSTFVSD